MEPNTIYIFTLSFPYGNGESFLESELPYLQKRFEKIILVPRDQSNEEQRPLPDGVMIDNSLAKAIPSGIWMMLNIIFSFFTNPGIYKEVLIKPHLLLRWKSVKLLLYYAVVKNVIRRWYKGKKGESAIYYTYWVESFTYGLCELKCREKIEVISRAHRYDLFEAKHSRPYLPFRKEIYSVLDQVHVVSEAGFNYLQSKEGLGKGQLKLSRLGTKDPGFLSTASSDGRLRIVSCSNVVELKRVGLIIDGISHLAKSESIKISWTHIGDGPLLDEIQEKANRLFSGSVDYQFLGSVPNATVMGFYRDTPTDVLINLSTIEGIPVSFMEAMSCGVPVIGTNVGGVSEILEDSNGIMLSENPSAPEISKALLAVHKSVDRNKLRNGARKTWEAKFNAEQNYSEFIRSISV